MERDSKSAQNSAVSRREFGRKAALAVAAATFAPSATISRASDTSPSLAQPQQGPDLSDLSPEARAEIDAKLANVIRRWGDRLDDEQKTRMRTIITRHVRMLETVRKFPLQNGDTPASVLKLFTSAPASARRPATAAPAKPAH